MQKFVATIEIIGVNPYVPLPDKSLKRLQKDAGRDRGPIPVRGILKGMPFVQTLVKYAGEWRLYLNTPMRTSTKTKVGDRVTVELGFDPKPRIVPIPPQLAGALAKNRKAKDTFEKLPPSRQKEINKYVGFLKSDEARKRNIEKIIFFLTGKKTEGVLFR